MRLPKWLSIRTVAVLSYMGVLLLVSVILAANGLMGLSPQRYLPGEAIPLTVGTLFSSAHVFRSYPYSLQTCMPSTLRKSTTTLGEHILGQQFFNTNYEIHFRQNVDCRVLCDLTLDEQELERYQAAIKASVKREFIVGGIEGRTQKVAGSSYAGVKGTPLGLLYSLGAENGELTAALFNHLTFKFWYRPSSQGDGSIVHFLVEPSFQARSPRQSGGSGATRQSSPPQCAKDDSTPLLLTPQLKEEAASSGATISFSYSTFFFDATKTEIPVASELTQASANTTDDIMLFSTINGALVLIFITLLVPWVLLVKGRPRDLLPTPIRGLGATAEAQSLEPAQVARDRTSESARRRRPEGLADDSSNEEKNERDRMQAVDFLESSALPGVLARTAAAPERQRRICGRPVRQRDNVMCGRGDPMQWLGVMSAVILQPPRHYRLLAAFAGASVQLAVAFVFLGLVILLSGFPLPPAKTIIQLLFLYTALSGPFAGAMTSWVLRVSKANSALICGSCSNVLCLGFQS